MKDWIKWGLVGGLWGLITVFYGLLTEQSQCSADPRLIITLFDCYQNFAQPIAPYFSKIPIALALPILILPYILFVALTFSAIYLIVKAAKMR